MKAKDKIAKASWHLLEAVKDQLRSDLIMGAQTGAFKLEKDQIERLVFLATTAADAGYHKAFKTFERVVTKSIEEIPVAPVDAKKN